MTINISRQMFERDIRVLLVNRIGIPSEDVTSVLEYINNDIKELGGDYRIATILSSLIIFIADAHAKYGDMEIDIVLQNHKTALNTALQSTDLDICPHCEGSGKIPLKQMLLRFETVPCPWCDSTGKRTI